MRHSGRVMLRRTAVVGAVCLALAVPVAGCGGGGSGPAAWRRWKENPRPRWWRPGCGDVDLEEALLAFTACMREEGIDLPDPELDAAGNLKLVSFMADAGAAAAAAGGTEALRDAATACRGHLAGVALRFASIDRTEMQDRLLAYAGCMREHGYDLPDPDFSGAGPGMRGPFPGLGLGVLGRPGLPRGQRVLPGGLRRPGSRGRRTRGGRMKPGRPGSASAASLVAVRAGGRAFAAAVLVLAALGVAARPAAATSPLEAMTAALQREADRLERLTTGPRVGGPDWAVDVQAQLTVVEVRVWRWRTAVAEVLAGGWGPPFPPRGQAPPRARSLPCRRWAWRPTSRRAGPAAAGPGRLGGVPTRPEPGAGPDGRAPGGGGSRDGRPPSPGPGVPGGRAAPFRAHLGRSAALGPGPQGRGRPRRAGHAPGRHRERDHRAVGLALVRWLRGVPGGLLQRRRLLLRPHGLAPAGDPPRGRGRGWATCSAGWAAAATPPPRTCTWAGSPTTPAAGWTWTAWPTPIRCSSASAARARAPARRAGTPGAPRCGCPAAG